jgi:hypothetical protein
MLVAGLVASGVAKLTVDDKSDINQSKP